MESVKAVNVITTANVWIEELREDADYGPIITKVSDCKQLDEVKLPLQDKHLRIANFCVENDVLYLILEDGSVAKVLSRSRRRAVFEAPSRIVAGHLMRGNFPKAEESSVLGGNGTRYQERLKAL